jgi:putative alpha-1,2-mannosidase
MTLEDGKKMVINAPGNSEQNLYVQSASLNGQPYAKNWISHQDLQKGGALEFRMGANPEKTRGTDPSAYPYSYSNNKK